MQGKNYAGVSAGGAGVSLLGEFAGSQNGGEIAPREHIREKAEQLVLDQAVGGEDFAAVEKPGTAGEVGNQAIGFLNQEQARGGVPGVQIELPVGREPPNRRGARRGSGG